MQTQLHDIRSFDYDDLIAFLKKIDIKAYRAKQIQEWLWKKGATNFESMTNLSKKLREQLSNNFSFNLTTVDTVQKSKDGTIKGRLRLYDGHFIETVLIPVVEDNRFTVCVSSQVGCSLSCSFCATGRMKRIRNLTAGEIYDQLAWATQLSFLHYDHPITNIVYMGMGEPLLAYKPVLQSISHITQPYGLDMSPRRITLSTAGIAKKIIQLADDMTKVNLAISLHAANDIKRNEIMPINESNNLEKLMDALSYFHQKTANRITFEYIAFRDFNDSVEDARELVKLCRRFPVRINIIEYNPIDNSPFKKSNTDKIDTFAQYLRDSKIIVTIRRSKGKDIDAACGQLANKNKNELEVK